MNPDIFLCHAFQQYIVQNLSWRSSDHVQIGRLSIPNQIKFIYILFTVPWCLTLKSSTPQIHDPEWRKSSDSAVIQLTICIWRCWKSSILKRMYSCQQRNKGKRISGRKKKEVYSFLTHILLYIWCWSS